MKRTGEGEGGRRKEGSSPASPSPNTSLYVQSDQHHQHHGPEPRPHQLTWLQVGPAGTRLVS